MYHIPCIAISGEHTNYTRGRVLILIYAMYIEM